MAKCCLLTLAVFFPCCAVMIDRGCGDECCITWLLSICGYIPGVVYAFIVLTKKEEAHPQNGQIIVQNCMNQTAPSAPTMTPFGAYSVNYNVSQPATTASAPIQTQAPNGPPPYPVSEKTQQN